MPPLAPWVPVVRRAPRTRWPVPPRRRPGRRLLRGALEALLFPLLFVAVGLSAWAVVRPAGGGAGSYPPVLVDSLPPLPESPGHRTPGPSPEPRIWLVDGFNVLQVALLGGRERREWWRQPQREALLARVAAFLPAAVGTLAESDSDSEPQVWVVFDGPQPRSSVGSASGGPQVVFAPSADEWILARIRASAAPERIALVSADRRLAARARHRGAQLVSPGAFLARCPIRGESTSV